MGKTTLKCTGLFVGVHTLLALWWMLYDAIVGAHDMNFGMVLYLLVRAVDFPSAWILKMLGAEQTVIRTLFLGTLQWLLLGALIGALYHKCVVAPRAVRSMHPSSKRTEPKSDPLAH